jgi:hypothetical protein
MVGLLPGQLTNDDRANHAVVNARDFPELLGQKPPMAEKREEAADQGRLL